MIPKQDEIIRQIKHVFFSTQLHKEKIRGKKEHETYERC